MGDGTAGGLKAMMDELSPDGWLIAAAGENRYRVETPIPIDQAGRQRIQAVFWPSTVLDFTQEVAAITWLTT